MTEFRVVLAVVLLLGLIGVVGEAGAIYLLWLGKPAEAVVGLASTAVGALAGILASTRTKPNGGGP